MADTVIDIPTVGRVAFPESMSPADVNAAAERLYREANPGNSRGKPRTWTDTAVDALPMVGGAVGGLVGALTGPGTAIAGAGAGGMVGERLRQYANAYRGTEHLPSAGDAILNMGKEGATQAAFEGGGQLVAKGLGMAGKAVYRGYLKPSLAAKNVGKADQIVQTALDEALPVTKAGAARATQGIGELKTEVQQILANTPGEVDLHQVADKVRAFAKAKYFTPGAPSADFEAAMHVADSIDQHAALGLTPAQKLIPGPVPVSASQANTVKRTLDNAIGENFGIERGATKTAQKVGRRATRQAIETRAPEVGPLNAREGRLIDAAKAINRAVGREGNQSASHGVKTLVAGAVGGEEYQRTHDPYASAAKALAVRMAMSPAVATRAAIVAYKLGQMSSEIPANIARIAVQVASEAQDQPDGGVANGQQ